MTNVTPASIRGRQYKLIPDHDRAKVHQALQSLYLKPLELEEDVTPARTFDLFDAINNDNFASGKEAQFKLSMTRSEFNTLQSMSAALTDRHHTYAKLSG